MIVAVGSVNPVKVAAVQTAFAAVFPEENITVKPADVESGVAAQPMSDRESIRGATTRAKKALKLIQADFGVGLEGGLQQINGRWFDCGWMVVVDRAGRVGIGSTLRMQVPERIMTLIRGGLELGDALDLVWKRQNIKQAEGHFGLMSRRLVTRTSGYRDGMIAALVRFMNQEMFDSGS
jgi:inosine/xanthosine triphosphatase